MILNKCLRVLAISILLSFCQSAICFSIEVNPRQALIQQTIEQGNILAEGHNAIVRGISSLQEAEANFAMHEQFRKVYYLGDQEGCNHGHVITKISQLRALSFVSTAANSDIDSKQYRQILEAPTFRIHIASCYESDLPEMQDKIFIRQGEKIIDPSKTSHFTYQSPNQNREVHTSADFLYSQVKTTENASVVLVRTGGEEITFEADFGKMR
jgi:hypothetical protein